MNFETTAASAEATGQGRSTSLGQTFSLAPWPPFAVPEYVTSEHDALAGAFKEAASDISRSRPGQNREDTTHHATQRLYASTRRIFVGLHPDVVAARRALQAVGNEKASPEYVEARAKLDDAVAVVEADTIRSIDVWCQNVCDKLRDDHAEKMAARHDSARQAVAELEALKARWEAFTIEAEALSDATAPALKSLHKLRATAGRFVFLDAAQSLHEGLISLRRAAPPADLRQRLGLGSDPAAEPKRGRPKKSREEN